MDILDNISLLTRSTITDAKSTSNPSCSSFLVFVSKAVNNTEYCITNHNMSHFIALHWSVLTAAKDFLLNLNAKNLQLEPFFAMNYATYVGRVLVTRDSVQSDSGAGGSS